MVVDSELAALRTIVAVQRAINNAGTADSVMRIVVDQAQAATGATGAVVELAEGDEMVYTTVSGTLAGTEGVRLSLSGSLSGLSVRSASVLIAEDTETDDRVDRAACRRVHARSMVVVPLRVGDATLGVLKVVAAQPAAFTAEHVDLLSQLADFIAAALNRAYVMQGFAQAATVDALTGIATRSALLDGLERAISEATMRGADVAVLYLDLDGFKPVNDKYGHAVGDEVLHEVGRRLKSACLDDDLPARIGGDEFAVLASSSHADPSRLRQDLITAVSAPVTTSAGIVRVGVSCGAAVVSSEDLAESVLARADAAMYADKRTRRAAAGVEPTAAARKS